MSADLPSSPASTEVCHRDKVCSHCHFSLSHRLFSRNKSNPDGLQSWCKACIKERYNYNVVADQVTVEQKQCGHCKLLKPSTDYNRNKARRDGLSVQCKPCLKEMTKTKPRMLAAVVIDKVCSVCAELKPACDFFASTRHRDGLSYACKACETKKKKRRKVTAPTVSHKTCAKCSQDKDACQFHADPYTSSGLCRYCRDCVLAQRWSNRVLKPTIDAKRCSLCAITKAAGGFTRNTFTSDGLASWCRTCTVQATKRKRYEETAQKALEQLAAGFSPTGLPAPPAAPTTPSADCLNQEAGAARTSNKESLLLLPPQCATNMAHSPSSPTFEPPPQQLSASTLKPNAACSHAAQLRQESLLGPFHAPSAAWGMQAPAAPTHSSLPGLLSLNMQAPLSPSSLHPAWPAMLGAQSFLNNMGGHCLALPLPSFSTIPSALPLGLPSFFTHTLSSDAASGLQL